MTGRPYSALDDLQQSAIDALYEHDECLALLETGFGKTAVELTVGEELRAAGIVKRPLVFAPLRVAGVTWPQEPKEWEHLQHIEMIEWAGPPDEWAPSIWRRSRELWGQRTSAEARLPKVVDTIKRRVLETQLNDLTTEERRVNKEARRTALPETWHVTSFENIAWLTDLWAEDSPFDMVVIDETGRVARNPKSPRYKALRKFMPSAKVRHGLNATPAPEGAEDLFGQVQLIAGKRIWGSSFYSWRQKFFTPIDYMAYSWRLQLGAFDLLMHDLNSVAFRIPAERLAYQKTMVHRQIEVTLPPKARAAYDEMEKTMAVELERLDANGEAESVIAMSEAAASQKLRQIVQGYLYETDEKGMRTVHMLHDEKLNALSDLIDSMGREPLLICYEYDQDLENIRRLWKNLPYLGQGASGAMAADNIARWNKRELPVLAAHPLSMSHGINLQYGGHHICWLTLPWSLDSYVQTNARIDRRGQTHNCFGHHLVARDTIDQKVSNALVEKHDAQMKIIQAVQSL